jgi:hypothetical protein
MKIVALDPEVKESENCLLFVISIVNNSYLLFFKSYQCKQKLLAPPLLKYSDDINAWSERLTNCLYLY